MRGNINIIYVFRMMNFWCFARVGFVHLGLPIPLKNGKKSYKKTRKVR